MPEQITISTQHYAQLLSDRSLLRALVDLGVDNWEWYEDACDLAQTYKKEALDEIC